MGSLSDMPSLPMVFLCVQAISAVPSLRVTRDFTRAEAAFAIGNPSRRILGQG